MSSRTFGRITAAVIIAAATMVGGIYGRRAFSQVAGGGAEGGAQRIESAYQEALSVISENYVDSVDYEKANEAAIQGMLFTLDPHSSFFSPAEYRRLLQDQESRFTGIGVSILRHRDGVYVQTPIEGTPAAKAGLRFGDRIVEVDGKDARDWTTQAVSKAVRGPEGEPVTLKVERAGSQAPLYFTIKRGSVPQPSIRNAFMLKPGVGYVGLTGGFTHTTSDELAAALEELSGQGMQQLILDLRGNPGGLLDQGVGVADLFLDPGQEIVSMRGRTSTDRRSYSDRAPQRWPQLSLVVLVNEGSASASEIVAGALQDHDRAVIVGRTSYGKGSAQSVFPMANGGALKVTTALWYTPSGRSINKKPINVNADDDAEDESDSPPTAADSAAKRKALTFHTDADRAVYGGGGITPDVAVGDTALAPTELAFQRALGKKLPQFRDALTDYALSLKGARTVTSPDFTVTPEMRDELWRRMGGRGITMPRATYDSASSLVDRLLSYEVARYVFGTQAEFRRVARDDETVAVALDLLSGEPTQAEVLRRAAARQTQETAKRTAAASTP
jgi:carboxyl-terminal processing protease